VEVLFAQGPAAPQVGPLNFVAIPFGLVAFVCFILVLVKMFQNDATQLGVTIIVLTCLCGIGPLIAFVVGWMRSEEWSIRPLMLVWTGCAVINLILAFAILLTQ
jgi:hypothetical protein